MVDIVVLHSGGMDSTVCLKLALEQNKSVLSLGINYGQTHQVEIEYARLQCRSLDVERKEIDVRWDKPNRLIPKDRNVSEIKSGRSSAFLPGRNMVFLAIASAEAAGIGAKEVWTGINQVDFSGYPDCTEEFRRSFQETLLIAIPDGPHIICPLMDMTKPQIAQEAIRLGLSKEDTWSCYRPVKTGETYAPCGKCDACVLHNYAWERTPK